jgi:hypothetical protein
MEICGACPLEICVLYKVVNRKDKTSNRPKLPALSNSNTRNRPKLVKQQYTQSAKACQSLSSSNTRNRPKLVAAQALSPTWLGAGDADKLGLLDNLVLLVVA